MMPLPDNTEANNMAIFINDDEYIAIKTFLGDITVARYMVFLLEYSIFMRPYNLRKNI